MKKFNTIQEFWNHPEMVQNLLFANLRAGGSCENTINQKDRCNKMPLHNECYLTKILPWGEINGVDTILWLCKDCYVERACCKTCKNKLGIKALKNEVTVCEKCQPSSTATATTMHKDTVISQQHAATTFVAPATAQMVITSNPNSNANNLPTYRTYLEYMRSAEWANFRTLVLKNRAGGLCEEILPDTLTRCTRAADHVHHTQYFPWTPDKGYQDTTNNLVALCHHCHEQRHTCLVCKIPSIIRAQHIKKQIRVCDSCIVKIQNLNI